MIANLTDCMQAPMHRFNANSFHTRSLYYKWGSWQISVEIRELGIVSQNRHNYNVQDQRHLHNVVFAKMSDNFCYKRLFVTSNPSYLLRTTSQVNIKFKSMGGIKYEN